MGSISDRSTSNDNCRSEDIAAYLDGELDAAALAHFEQHIKECSSCSECLGEQRRLLCAIDLALDEASALPLPKNFAAVVAARAQADMSGMRGRSERKRALTLCVLLAMISFILLGASFNEAALGPISAIAKLTLSLLGFLWHALYSAGAGFAVIARTVGGHFIFESHPFGLLVFLLLAAALLSLLINNYRRTRIIE